MSKNTSIESWQGSRLQVFMPWYPEPVRIPDLDGDYRPIGEGLAVPAGPLTATVDGIVLEYDLRGGSLECVGITSAADGPPITWEVLRNLQHALRRIADDLFERSVVRLIQLDDGTIAGELAWKRTSHGVHFGTTGDDVRAATKRMGRPPVPAERLERVAQLYREAERLGVARTAFIARQFPGYSDAAIRNWVRRARKDGMLEQLKED
jgi:hypothetical protein